MSHSNSLSTFLSFFSSFFLFLLCPSNAYNITKMLSQYPDFSSFNSLLTQTQVADQINSRRTITVLAVDNSAMSPVSGKSSDEVKRVLSLHVVLDYYDVQKLQKLPNKTAILTTLFQSSGVASGKEGFLNVTDLSTGSVAFGSATPGSSLGSNLVKSIVSQPYNISVLQVSAVIMPGAGGGANSSGSKPPSPSATPAASPSMSPSAAPSPKAGKAPAPSPTSGGGGGGDSPGAAPSADSSSAPSDSPFGAADGPSTADTPAGSPPLPAASGPAADGGGAADAPAGNSSGSSAVGGGGLAVVMMMISSVWFMV